MPHYAYERLSATDNIFLLSESPTMPMHIAALQVIESGSLSREDGGIDVDRYKQSLEGVLHRIPRYRQKLKYVAFDERPVWVDDRHFDLDYHIRHSSLPAPGTREQLNSLVSRIVSRPLDRERPLWEIWVVEGLDAGNQFALISKIHHCMLDGAAGADLASILASPEPKAEIPARIPYLPKPAPSIGDLMVDDALRLAKMPLRALRGAYDLATSSEAVTDLEARGRALGELASWTLKPASATPLNGKPGPHRSFDWLTMPLYDVKDVKNAFGCTVNDIVLATVTGAVRGYLQRRGVEPTGLDFRISVPVGMRGQETRGQMGNFLSSWVLPLPIDEADPNLRVSRVSEGTQERKNSDAALGFDTLMSLAEFMPNRLVKLGAQAASMPANIIVTNVVGPPFPLFQLGAKLLGIYPMVPCLPGSGLGIALFSYDGKLCWGFNADPSMVPDLPAFVGLVKNSFEELRTAAARRVTAPRRVRRPGEAAETDSEAEDRSEMETAHMPALAMM